MDLSFKLSSDYFIAFMSKDGDASSEFGLNFT